MYNIYFGFFQWSITYTWFPGFAWKVCLCPKCASHLGWMFEPIETATKEQIFPSDKGFYAITVKNIVAESCKYRALALPTFTQ